MLNSIVFIFYRYLIKSLSVLRTQLAIVFIYIFTESHCRRFSEFDRFAKKSENFDITFTMVVYEKTLLALVEITHI